MSSHRHDNARRKVAPFSRIAVTLLCALAVAGPGSIAAIASAQSSGAGGTSTSTRHAIQAAAKKKKKKKKKKAAPKKKAADNRCNVLTLNRKTGKYQIVYVTKKVKVRVRSHGRTVTVTKTQRVAKKGPCLCPQTKTVNGKRTIVYLTLTINKHVKSHGKSVTKRVKVKVQKLVRCSSQNGNGSGNGSGTGSGSSLGLPVTITIVPPSSALLDFQAFQRTSALGGVIKGFFTGGFNPSADNQLLVTAARITVAQTPIFIDDVCAGQVSSSIRTDPSTFAEIDPGSAQSSNSVRIDPAGNITGLIHLRLQVSLQLRNDDNGCNQAYITTGWTDLTTPLFLSGKLSGLTSTIKSGQTVLSELSACVAPGPPTLACNGFAIPFPAIFSSTIVGNATLG